MHLFLERFPLMNEEFGQNCPGSLWTGVLAECRDFKGNKWQPILPPSLKGSGAIVACLGLGGEENSWVAFWKLESKSF